MPTPLPPPLTLLVREVGDVRVHTFVAGFTGSNIANATHIVEGPSCLVLVDGQFLTPYAHSFRAFADSLGKPIDRLYLSHRHPDHWLGLGAAFDDVPVHALPETIDFLREHGEDSLRDHWRLGTLIADRVVVPQQAVEPGEQVVDGVTYQLERVEGTECDHALTLRLPDLGIHVVQDLVYSGTHLYLTQDLDRWIGVLGAMTTSGYDLFLPGHGLPADRNEVARNAEYLAAAAGAVADGLSGDAFRQYLLARYPARLCPGIFDIYLPRLFDGVRSY